MIGDIIKPIRTCEVCDSDLNGPSLDLGRHPLCDDLVKIGSLRKAKNYRQKVTLCTQCLTVHQRYPVAKEELFQPNYHYRAALTKDDLSGMSDLVNITLKRVGHRSDRPLKILDVGCNDGSLLKIFKQNCSCVTVGVDPTNAITEQQHVIDYPINSYFNAEVSAQILADVGQPDIITFTNVFAHIEDLPSLLISLKSLVGPDTHVVIENHYLGSIVEKTQFDTFYHEHPRTYSLNSFSHIAKRLGLKLSWVDFPHRYNGNIRVHLTSSDFECHNLEVLLHGEYHILEKFIALQSLFNKWQENSSSVVEKLTASGWIVGKGMPGRAVMLVSSLELSDVVMPRVYEQPFSPKVGCYVPGTKIEIVSDDLLLQDRDSELVLWAWHIPQEVVPYIRKLGFTGNIWTPLPEFVLISPSLE